MAKILLKFNMAVIREIPVKEGTVQVTIGRKEDNDIVIDNPAVSGHHARLVKQGNKFFVEDLNSTNGTFIDGKKILKAEMQHNAQVDIAKHSLVFLYDTPQEAPAMQDIPIKSSDQTVVIDASRQKEMLQQSMAPIEKEEEIGCIKITDGIVDNTEIELAGLNTYLGTEETSQVKIIPIKGFLSKATTGNFALINKKAENHYLFKAIKEGLCKVDGKFVHEEIVELGEGSMIEIGKTKMIFFLKHKTQ